MQATSFEEQLDIKEKEIYQAIEDFRMSMESEMKRRARSNNDLMIENKKFREQMNEVLDSNKLVHSRIQALNDNVKCVIES